MNRPIFEASWLPKRLGISLRRTEANRILLLCWTAGAGMRTLVTLRK